MKQSITIKQLAAALNISVNTVSRALNGKDGVSEETRKKIVDLSTKLGYRPNLIARSMKYNKSNLIGILVGDITNTFFTQLLEGADTEANKEKMIIMVGNSAEDIYKENENINAHLSYNCSGIIISPVLGNTDVISKLQSFNTNFVVVDRPVEDVECDKVCIDNEEGSYRAVKHLVENGHKKIAIIINTKSHLKTEEQRYSGYIKALSEAEIQVDKELVINCATHDEAYENAYKLLSKESNRPSAVFIARQNLGLSTLAAINDLNLKIPDDISIIIFGEPEWANVLKPKITCVKRPIKKMGQIAMKILIEEIKGERKDGFHDIKLKSELVIRDSVKML